MEEIKRSLMKQPVTKTKIEAVHPWIREQKPKVQTELFQGHQSIFDVSRRGSSIGNAGSPLNRK
jgi:hypothetical protein